MQGATRDKRATAPIIEFDQDTRGHFISLSLDYAKLKMTGQTKFERYRVDLVRMMEEGVAKKEMARRTRLSIQTIRKYLTMIAAGGA